jgi:curved DNA-binding protein CbpA
MNPYLILRVLPNASDTEIRRAYLDAVRKFPPEREPERFQTISHAYEQIRDEKSRLNHLLFDRAASPGATPFEVFVKFCAASPMEKPLDFEAMKAFLRSCTTT